MFVAGDHKVGLERNQLVAESRNAYDVATRITLSLCAFRARARARERERETITIRIIGGCALQSSSNFRFNYTVGVAGIRNTAACWPC